MDEVLLSEAKPIVVSPPAPLRWWVLATYSLMAANQGLTWSVPGTLTPTYLAVYGMDQNTVQLLLNYGPVCYLLFMLPVAYQIDRFGIRPATVSGIALVLAANALRCLANDASAASVALVHVSFVLNAIAGPAAMAVPSKLAEDWFAPSERTTATAVAALASQTGVLLLYLFIPTLSPDPTVPDNFHLNLMLLAISLLNAVMAAAYLPSHPPSAPSASAGVTRRNEALVTARGLAIAWRAMLANRGYVAILVVYSLFAGVSNCTSALLTANLAAVGADQATAGWVGFGANSAALVVGLLFGAVTDALKRRSRAALKHVLVACTAGSGAAFALYYLLVSGAVGGGGGGGGGLLWAVAAAYTVACALLGASIPIMFDLGAEITYPQPEGAMLMLLTGGMNAVGLLVLAAPASSFFEWANATTAGVGLAGAALLLAFVPSAAPRFDFDVRAEDSAARRSFLGDDAVGGEEDAGGDGSINASAPKI